STHSVHPQPEDGDNGAGASEAPKVQVRLTTNISSASLRIPSSTPILLLPSSLGRFGLSEVINHLLSLPAPTPFDFLINGRLLRTSIKEFSEEKGLSLEAVLEVEYILSSQPPALAASLPQDDWISDVAVTSFVPYILTTSYEGLARVLNRAGKEIATLGEIVKTSAGRRKPLRAAAWVDGTFVIGESGMREDTVFGLVGSDDGVVTMWEISPGNGMAYPLYASGEHMAGVTDLAVSPSGRHFASSSTDGKILLYSTRQPQDAAATDASVPSSQDRTKRRKVNVSTAPRTQSILSLEKSGATSTVVVSSVCFDTIDGDQIYSGGWDHAVRGWDVETGVERRAMTCDKVVLSIDHSPLSTMLATGHADGVVRIWDPRSNDGSLVKLHLSSRSPSFHPAVKWSPTSAFHVAAGSHDGHVRIWDLRSDRALYAIAARGVQEGKGSEKVLAIDWVDGLLVSGGEGRNVDMWNVK
ncbi:WD40 repeat-like protein, partial [Gonapodya prolifera JEL478]